MIYIQHQLKEHWYLVLQEIQLKNKQKSRFCENLLKFRLLSKIRDGIHQTHYAQPAFLQDTEILAPSTSGSKQQHGLTETEH